MIKGQKISPPVVPTKEYIENFVKKREVNIHKSQARMPANVADRNYKYLSSVFEAMVKGYEEQKLPKKLKDAPSCMRRYTPLQMFEGAVAYVRSAIEAKQPLTICGLGLFLGIRRADFFDILHKKTIMKNPFMNFIYDFATFIEMYDEYAAHQKQNPAGPIFILKNFGWKDKFEIEASATQGALTPEERDEARRRMANFAELPEGQ